MLTNEVNCSRFHLNDTGAHSLHVRGGSIATFPPSAGDSRFTPNNGHRQIGPAGPVRATNGPRVVRKQCPVVAFYSCRNCIALLLTAGFNNRAPPGRAADWRPS